jgi:hypothetical protein
MRDQGSDRLRTERPKFIQPEVPKPVVKKGGLKRIVGQKYGYFVNALLGEGANGRVYRGFEVFKI